MERLINGYIEGLLCTKRARIRECCFLEIMGEAIMRIYDELRKKIADCESIPEFISLINEAECEASVMAGNQKPLETVPIYDFVEYLEQENRSKESGCQCCDGDEALFESGDLLIFINSAGVMSFFKKEDMDPFCEVQVDKCPKCGRMFA